MSINRLMHHLHGWKLPVAMAMLSLFIVEGLFFAGLLGGWISIVLMLICALLVGSLVGTVAANESIRRAEAEPTAAMLRSLYEIQALRARMKLPNDEWVPIEPTFRVKNDGGVQMAFFLTDSDEQAEIPAGAKIELGRKASEGDGVDSVIELDPHQSGWFQADT